jgi:hypothetical protein
VQAIKKGDEIVVLARIILRLGNFKTNPIARAGVFRALLRRFDGLVVIVEADKLRFRIRFASTPVSAGIHALMRFAA